MQGKPCPKPQVSGFSYIIPHEFVEDSFKMIPRRTFKTNGPFLQFIRTFPDFKWIYIKQRNSRISPVWFWFSWGPWPRWLLIRCNLPPGGWAHSDQVNLSFNTLSPRGGSLSFLFLKETVSRAILNFLILNNLSRFFWHFTFLTSIFGPKKQGFWIFLSQNWSIEDYILCLWFICHPYSSRNFFPKPCAISWFQIFPSWCFFKFLDIYCCSFRSG